MNLYIDIGNSAVKFGIDKNNDVEFLCYLKNDEIALDVLKAKLPNKVDKIIISSVVPTLSEKISEMLKSIYKVHPIILKSTDKSGVNINIDNPSELGCDLLADLAAANKYYGTPILIIDAGTATKFLYIDEKKTFFSCAIVPGLELQLKMLNTGTALLPDSTVKEVKPLLKCHNTIDVITSSSYYSHIDMINGMVDRYEKEIGHLVKKVVTGGNISKIKDLLKFEYIYDPTLCLKGVKVVGEGK